MEIQIENLKAKMLGVEFNSYQKALALDEFEKLIAHTKALEQQMRKCNAICRFFAKDVSEIKKIFPWQSRQPRWLKEYLLLIKTRRGNKYYAVKGLSFVGRFSVKGFSKFKVIGWRELPQNEAEFGQSSKAIATNIRNAVRH